VFSVTALILLVSSVAVSGIFGGWMWLLTAVILPLLTAWYVARRVLSMRAERAPLQGPAPFVGILGGTLIAVAIALQVVAFAIPH
jgi:hypothetical protein